MPPNNAEEGVALRNLESGSRHRPCDDNTGDKVISTRNRMGLIGFLSVLAGMAVIFGAEEGLVEEKAWSNEMAAIENATKQRDTGKFRYALMDDMTWNLAKEACSAISNEYELCTVSELCSQTEDGLKAHTLCQPQSQCDGLEAVGGFRNRWAPVQKDGGASDGEWVHVEKNCQVGNFPQDVAVKGILTCCHNGVLLPIHPPPFPGANAGSSEPASAREEHGIHSPEWEWSSYAAQVRQSDPFLKSKKEGGKMKGLHTHLQDGINQHLNGETAKAIAATVKGFVGSGGSAGGQPAP